MKDFDLEKANSAVKRIAEIKTADHLEMLKAMKEMRTILTDEQFKKMNKMMPMKTVLTSRYAPITPVKCHSEKIRMLRNGSGVVSSRATNNPEHRKKSPPQTSTSGSDTPRTATSSSAKVLKTMTPKSVTAPG